MTLDDPADTGESYATLALYQPPTAHHALFSDALTAALDRVRELVPRFGLRNPRMGIEGTYTYEFCTADEWVASFWSGQL
ncbi:MAG: hypothetical protein AAGJ92_08980, partial [Pseudomonadota bacterium]